MKNNSDNASSTPKLWLVLTFPDSWKQIKHAIVQEPFSLCKINQTGAIQFSEKADVLKLQRVRVENYSCFHQGPNSGVGVFACLMAFSFNVGFKVVHKTENYTYAHLKSK